MIRRAAPPGVLALLPFALLPVAMFLLLMHPATLDIGNAGWLIRGSDNGENALGLHAYLHDARAGWSLRTSLLNAPEGVALLFTDSNPLLALLVKPFAGWLPADAQVLGWWFLLCLVLQTLFAAALLRDFAPDRWALWGGTALLVLMPTLANRFVHLNLCAHWLVLWSLWIYADPARAGRLAWWGPAIAVTALVHSYLLVMVGAVWASAMIERFAAGDSRGRLAAQVVVVLAAVVALAAWLGVGGRYALAGNYGAFAMPLDALWNPGNASYSALLPSVAQREGRGFEGFQYLGAGGLALIAAAVVAAWRWPRGAAEAGLLARLRWLAPALVVLTLLAVSNAPDAAGVKVARVPLPEAFAPGLDAVRASGRLFWPVAYVGMIVALIALYRLPGKLAGQALVLLIAVQLVDLSAMHATIRAASADAGERRTYLRTANAEWARLIARADDVAFVGGVPADDLQLFQEVAWRAVPAGKPVRQVYAARTPVASARRLAGEEAAFARGRIAPRRLYVLLARAGVPTGAERRARVIDGVRVIVPVR